MFGHEEEYISLEISFSPTNEARMVFSELCCEHPPGMDSGPRLVDPEGDV